MSKREFFVELSIPNTTKSMGFYLEGASREDVVPHTPFILEDGVEYDSTADGSIVSNEREPLHGYRRLNR